MFEPHVLKRNRFSLSFFTRFYWFYELIPQDHLFYLKVSSPTTSVICASPVPTVQRQIVKHYYVTRARTNTPTQKSPESDKVEEVRTCFVGPRIQ